MSIAEFPESKQPTGQPQQKPFVVSNQRRKILYVVHRYAPYPGGSENYVRDMAEETLARGHEVTVFAGEHQGDLNGVQVTNDPKILFKPWDLIVVHGGDVPLQNFVLDRADQWGGPVLYLIILPSHSKTCVSALHKARWVGCSTLADWRHVRDYHAEGKAVTVRHGINGINSIGIHGFKEIFNIRTPYMFLSSGGYWPNKGMGELVETFNSLGRTDVTLVLTGYDNRHQLMPQETEFVKPFLFLHRDYMLSALRDADLYILNSISEGFGLVLLEAMLNETPWVARHIAGAEVLKDYGHTYTSQEELASFLKTFKGVPQSELLMSQKYVIGNRLIGNTVSDILRVLS